MNAATRDGPRPRTTKSRGYSISYEDSGSGPAVLLVPGYMQTAAEYRRTGYVDHLAGRRVLIVDPLGHGKSDKPYDGAPYRSPGVAADIIAVLDAANLETAALWGYSRGAWLAAMAAIEFPSRVSALVLGGADLTSPPPTALPAWVEPLTRGDWPRLWSLFPIPLSVAVMRHIEAVNDPRALAAERIGRIESAYVFDLARVSAPAFVYCCDGDVPEEAVPTADALKTELHVVPDCDHRGGFEVVDRVAPHVIRFLDSLA